MKIVAFSLILLSIVQLFAADDGTIDTINSLYRCGVRKRFGQQLIHHGRPAELGQWPWHAALYHGSSYKCGGSLIDQRHVITSAHCVVNSNQRALKPRLVNIRLGLHDLSDQELDHVLTVNVSEIHLHEDFVRNQNDIALLVLSDTVRFSDYVIPICLEPGYQNRQEDLVNQRGWTAGWGETEDGTISKLLKTISMPVVNHTECIQNDPELFARFISDRVLCASDKNGTSVCRGDSGGGMYISAGDHWELRGITSFSGLSESGSCDTSKYIIFTNVVYYYDWIKNLASGGLSQDAATVPKRISEMKCQEYAKLASKRPNGVCFNSRSPHTVAIVDRNQRHIQSGSIVSEKFILTKAPSLFDVLVSEVDWEEIKVRVGNQPPKDVLREISHPGYEAKTLRHHIMLLELETPLTFSNTILPTCLSNPASENLYDTLLLNGYGGQAAKSNGFFESVENRVISSEQCEVAVQKSPQKYAINKEDLCATVRHAGFLFWSGIVGGPLQTVNTRTCMFSQIGVTKFLIPHDLGTEGVTNGTRYTNVYSRITAYLDWIEEVVWGNGTEAASEVASDESAEGEQTAAQDADATTTKAQPTTIRASTAKQPTTTAAPRSTLKYSPDFYFPD